MIDLDGVNMTLRALHDLESWCNQHVGLDLASLSLMRDTVTAWVYSSAEHNLGGKRTVGTASIYTRAGLCVCDRENLVWIVCWMWKLYGILGIATSFRKRTQSVSYICCCTYLFLPNADNVCGVFSVCNKCVLMLYQGGSYVPFLHTHTQVLHTQGPHPFIAEWYISYIYNTHMYVCVVYILFKQCLHHDLLERNHINKKRRSSMFACWHVCMVVYIKCWFSLAYLLNCVPVGISKRTPV